MPGTLDGSFGRRSAQRDEHAAAIFAMREGVDRRVEDPRERTERRKHFQPHEPGKDDEHAAEVFRTGPAPIQALFRSGKTEARMRRSGTSTSAKRMLRSGSRPGAAIVKR